jgi:hypothetical protein
MKLELQKYNTVIAAVQETESKGKGTTDVGYFTMFYSTSKDKYTSDIRFI